MTKAFLIDGIAKLGNWNCSMAGEDLSTIKFYDDSGNEISRPDDFPTQARTKINWMTGLKI